MKKAIFLSLTALNLTLISMNCFAEDNKYQKTEEALRKLSAMQYNVTQKNQTEAPFHNEYWDNHEEGIYVDVVTGEPLFSSTDKFDSGTGWPSFSKPIDDNFVTNHVDRELGMERTEVKSKNGGSHLGHVFDDGPEEMGGKRFCINSAAMRFIPKAELESQGYSKYLKLFEKK